MVQGNKDVRLCKCTPQHLNPREECRTKSSPRPISNSKYSTVNFVPPVSSTRHNNTSVNRYQGNNNVSNRIHCQTHQQQNKSSWDKCTASSCLVGFMKFIQHQCYPKKKQDMECQQVIVIHEDVATAMRQLKCDLEYITEIERKNSGNLNVIKNGESPRKILTRMAFKIYEIEDRLLNPNIPTCRELLTKRKAMLNLIKTLQKTIGCYLECEVEALKDRQAKLCNLLRCLQCIENEFRCMTKGIKSQCCSRLEDSQHKSKSNLTLAPIKKKSNNYIEKEPCTNITNNYEVTGVDVVYTKSRIKTLEPDTCNGTNNTEERLEEESINKQIACHIPKDGSPICEVKIRDGKETLQLCESTKLQQAICEMSNVWYESARQLINAFHSSC